MFEDVGVSPGVGKAVLLGAQAANKMAMLRKIKVRFMVRLLQMKPTGGVRFGLYYLWHLLKAALPLPAGALPFGPDCP